MRCQKVTNVRAGAIVVHQGCLLLIHRIKKGLKEYYVFPGGTVEGGEEIQLAAIREVREETSIIVQPGRLMYYLQVTGDEKTPCGKEEYYFLCDYLQGVPQLEAGAIEWQRISQNNLYQPVWVPLDQITTLLIYPLEIRDLLVIDLEDNKGLSLYTKTIEIVCSKLRDI